MRKIHIISLYLLALLLVSCETEKAKQSQLSEEFTKWEQLPSLQKLKEGNKRFVSGNLLAPNRSEERRMQTLEGQDPFAAVLTCSDSRISPTLFFDTGIGDLFIVRTAGNVIGEMEIASLEFAVSHLNVDVIVVMGHTDCGAIKAFVNGKREKAHIQIIIDSMSSEPEEKEALKTPFSIRINFCVLANITHQAKFLIENSKIIAERVKEGKLQIVEAEYEHKSGIVQMLKVYPDDFASTVKK
jgi:carbonic anhydrase